MRSAVAPTIGTANWSGVFRRTQRRPTGTFPMHCPAEPSIYYFLHFQLYPQFFVCFNVPPTHQVFDPTVTKGEIWESSSFPTQRLLQFEGSRRPHAQQTEKRSLSRPTPSSVEKTTSTESLDTGASSSRPDSSFHLDSELARGTCHIATCSCPRGDMAIHDPHLKYQQLTLPQIVCLHPPDGHHKRRPLQEVHLTQFYCSGSFPSCFGLLSSRKASAPTAFELLAALLSSSAYIRGTLRPDLAKLSSSAAYSP